MTHTTETTPNAEKIAAGLADELRYIATILEANASKFAVPDHIPQKARKCREAADLLARTAAQPEREAVLEEHFPTGLRSTRHVLSATGEVFESPIQCECHCGACFVGTDEQEVRQLWAAHAAALTTPAPAETGRERLAKQIGVAMANRADLPDPLISPAVSTDEIVAVGRALTLARMAASSFRCRLEAHELAEVDAARAILSRIRGEGE